MLKRIRPVFCILFASLLSFAFSSAAFGQALTLVQTSYRYAGTGSGGFTGDFGPATSLAVNKPSYIVLDSLGNEFISDTANNCVRRVDVNGNMTTVAGLGAGTQGDTCNSASNPTPSPAQGLYRPTGLALDAANNLYIADAGHNCIRRLSANSVGASNLTTVAGTCTTVNSASSTPNPSGLVFDAFNNLYISIQDTEIAPAISNYQVLRQSLSSQSPLCVIAGNPSVLVPNTCAGVLNGVQLSSPSGLAKDYAGNVYVADTGNNCVRQIVGNTAPFAITGKCSNDGVGNAATALTAPFGITFSLIQSLFITEPNNVVRYVPGTTTLTTVAGLPGGTAGGYTTSQDGTSALNVPLNGARGIAVDANSNFYIADSQNNVVRELSFNVIFPDTPVNSPSSILPITFVINQHVNLSYALGTDYAATSSSCVGNLTPAPAGAPPVTCQVFVRFIPSRPGMRNSPLKITDSISGKTISIGLQGRGTGALGLFVPGIVNTVAGGLASPTAIATDSTGNAYVLERGNTPGTADVRIILASGGTSTFAIPQGAGLTNPIAISSDAAGNWFVVDGVSGTVARFGADGSVNLNYVTGLVSPSAVYADAFGNLFIAQQGSAHNVIEIFGAGQRVVIAGSGSNTQADGVPAAQAQFVSPGGVTIDLNGVLYISDTGGHRVYAVDKTGLIHFVAGNGTTTTTTPGVALGTALISPSSIATDAAADLYIADQGANKVYALYAAGISGANITTVLGTGVAGYSGDGGLSILGRVNGPLSVALDGSSNAFIVDSSNNAVREITYPNPTVDFGSVVVGQSSAPRQQYFTNVGTDSLNLTAPFSTSDTHFTIDAAHTTCGTAILPGSVCDVSYIFTPTALQSYIATSTLVSNSYNSPQPLTLKGNGITQITVTPTTPPATEVYGQPFPIVSSIPTTGTNPPATGTVTYTINGQTVCTTSGTLSPSSTCNAANSGLPVGTYTITLTYSGDSNYAPTTTTFTLTITPQPITVTGGTVSRIYGQPNPTLTGTITGVVPGDTILATYTTTATPSSPVGSYAETATLTAVGNTSLSNYAVTVVPGTLVITPAPLTVTVGSATRPYGTPNPTFVSTISGAVNGDTFTNNFTSTAGTFSPVGSYPINDTLSGSALGNYNVTVVPGALTVTKATTTVTVSATNASRVYGAPNPTFTSTVTGALNGDTFTITYITTATPNSPVGTYTVTPVVSGPAAANYNFNIAPGTLTITPATLTVTANDATRAYGAPNPTFSSTVNGALNGDTFNTTYVTTATATSPAGTYPIIPTVSGAGISNYNVVVKNGTLTVTQASANVTITVANASKVYGSPNPTFSATIVGAVNGDVLTATFSTTATTGSPVGSYPVTATLTGTNAGNYTATVAPGTLTITPAPLSVAANNATRVYGSPNPAFTGTVSGLVNGDTVSTSFITTATATSNAGTYPIVPVVSGPALPNYALVTTNGTLTVTPAATATVVVTSATPVQPGVSVTFTATVTSPAGIPTGTVTFSEGTTALGTGTVNATGVATFSTSTLTSGSHTITATYGGATNFGTSSGTVNQAVGVTKGVFTIAATPSTQFVRGAATTYYNVTVTSVNGFTGPVALTCNGLPVDATCSFEAQVVTLTAGGTATTRMIVTNTAADAMLIFPASPFSQVELGPIVAAAMFPFELGGMGMLLAGFGRRRKTRSQQKRLLLMLFCTLGILGLAGCGCPNTAFKTYTINVVGTAVNNNAPTQITQVTLSVGGQ